MIDPTARSFFGFEGLFVLITEMGSLTILSTISRERWSPKFTNLEDCMK
jgi:hypothetical protein